MKQDEDGEEMLITHEVLERRKALGDKMLMMTGISAGTLYVPGIVTLNDSKGMVPYLPNDVLILVAWKIDDMPWKVRTTGLWRISDNDPDAREGLTAFAPDTTSWSWGVAPFLIMADAVLLRDRILRLTREFGLDIDSFEASILPKAI